MEFNRVIQGDVREIARQLPDQCVHTIVTSPPYYLLRDYGEDRQLGCESTPQEYVEVMVSIFGELRRVLRDDGTLWLNLGDTYSKDGKNGGRSFGKNATSAAGGYQTIRNAHLKTGVPAKNLYGIPWRVALALQADGWYLRSDIIWSKPSCLPESVKDRPTKSHEYIFLLTKSPRYFYDADAIREPYQDSSLKRIKQNNFDNQAGGEKDYANGTNPNRSMRKTLENFKDSVDDNRGRNRRTVWEIATRPYPEAHFAVFPPDLIKPCILAGCPEKVCAGCGAPYVKVIEKGFTDHDGSTDSRYEEGTTANRLARLRQTARENGGEYVNTNQVIGEEPTCQCGAGTTAGVVLDPFLGSGTTAQVALEMRRRWLGIELNQEYMDLIYKRLAGLQPALIPAL